MKIAIRGGHNYGVTGAKGILDEVTEDRKYYAAVVNYLKAAGHQVFDVTPSCTASSSEDLSYGVRKANELGVDFFVSCHVNAGGGRGCEVLYYNGSTKGKEYATKVVSAITSLGFINRGAKVDARNLYELRASRMPAIIIEPFFLDTQSDVDIYNKIGADKLGKAIAEAVHGGVISIAPLYPGYYLKYNTEKVDNNVKLIQEKLKLGTDGVFGPKTLATIRSFQANNGLDIDGIVGIATWNKIFK